MHQAFYLYCFVAHAAYMFLIRIPLVDWQRQRVLRASILLDKWGQCSCSNNCSVPVTQKRKGSLDQEQILQLFGPLAGPKRIDAST
jgi:hypothetical protein